MKNISIALLILLAGITQAFAGNVQYVSPSEVNQVRKVEIGQIIGLKHVRVDESNFIRTAVGGGIGYAIGSQIGKGSGNKIAKIAGTLIGAGAAQKKTDATEITVKVMHGKQGKKSVSYVDSMY